MLHPNLSRFVVIRPLISIGTHPYLNCRSLGCRIPKPLSLGRQSQSPLQMDVSTLEPGKVFFFSYPNHKSSSEDSSRNLSHRIQTLSAQSSGCRDNSVSCLEHHIELRHRASACTNVVVMQILICKICV